MFAPLAAVVLSLFHAGLPQVLATSLDLIGVGAAGVMLFLTGLILSSQAFRLNGNVVSGTPRLC